MKDILEIPEMHIAIGRETIPAINPDKKTFFVYRTRLRIGRLEKCLETVLQNRNLRIRADIVKIFINSRVVDLPEQIIDRLLLFFVLRPDTTDGFDCHRFIHLLKNVSPLGGGGFNQEAWDWNILNKEDDLATGESIAIFDDHSQIQHSALFVAEGLYLSMSGVNGPLIVASLPETLKGHRGKFAMHISPKR